MNSNLRKLACSHIAYRIGFINAIYILFFQYIGFTFESIGVFEAITSITILLVDIPSGVFADRQGRKNSILLSYFSWFLLMILFAISSANWIILICAGILNGCDFAFRSGADSALIYDILQSEGQSDTFLKVKGQFSSLGLLATTFSMLLGGFLFVINPRIPYYCQIVTMGCAILLLSFVHEPPLKSSTKLTPSIYSQMKKSVSIVFKNRDILWITFFSLFFGVFIESYWDIYSQFHFQELGVSDQYIPFLFAFFLLLGAFGASIVHKMVDFLGERATFYGVIVSQSLIFIFMGMITSWWGMSILVGLLVMNREMGFLVIENFENLYIKSSQRASVLSAMSSMRNSIFGGPVIIWFFGWLFDRILFSSIMIWTGGIVISIGVFLILIKDRMHKKHNNDSRM
ncbi:hypothetical protein NEF87_001088 [Candidatus Lokiarchaeum ossiferum]|uniref:Major facilitator superfamily (MFS) profile domain-containing protein n=1 Tax=Candidatus Lokiarchaeum ossiferum TaxID=2951803 RepID=A0ABY6HMS1_9ARCH|nr:hypothetical protein NEF87_001088 [Candidatus Lokiarchaeum sp. B-35]